MLYTLVTVALSGEDFVNAANGENMAFVRV